MAIRLEKGQRINLEKSSGVKLTNFCVGCNWGAVERMQRKEVVVSEGFLGFGQKTEWRNVKCTEFMLCFNASQEKEKPLLRNYMKKLI